VLKGNEESHGIQSHNNCFFRGIWTGYLPNENQPHYPYVWWLSWLYSKMKSLVSNMHEQVLRSVFVFPSFKLHLQTATL
jgi:hypothetical protein